MTNSISTRLIIFTLSALLAFAVAEREFNLCAREEKVNNQLPNFFGQSSQRICLDQKKYSKIIQKK